MKRQQLKVPPGGLVAISPPSRTCIFRKSRGIKQPTPATMDHSGHVVSVPPITDR